MKKIALIGLWACLLASLGFRLYAQEETVYKVWGKSFGKAHTDRDFLIYDATCLDNKLFIVGKAENGTDFELKQGENTYFYAKDSTTDAFLACYSLDGELLWSTYLPALEDGYYNAFASTVGTDSNHIVVVGNAYQIQETLEHTKNLIPQCSGKLFILELDVSGDLVRQKTFDIIHNEERDKVLPLPLINRFVEQKDVLPPFCSLLGGISLRNYTYQNYSDLYTHIYSFPVLLSLYPQWKEDAIEDNFFIFSFSSPCTYIACQMIHPNLWNFVNRSARESKESLYLAQLEIRPDEYSTKSADTSYTAKLHSGAIDLLETSRIYESWNITSSENTGIMQHYAYPSGTRNRQQQFLFPGTIQNIRTFNGKYLVQGIHCRNYNNGFFKKDGEPYTYSHDTEHLIPKGDGFYQNRNNNHIAVPYLLLYDSATLFGTVVSEEDSRVYDYRPPLWGSYLNVDWMYEDIFHVTDSAQWKDIYQPYEAILCSSDDRFFLIGNAKSIGKDLIDNLSMTDEAFHHQGVILAFSINCPPENTVFQDVRFLCPDDSVELKLSPDYAGFKFRFDPAFLADGSLALDADSSRAWAKKEGIFSATLDGSALGCPDVSVDTVRISFSPYPEPVSALDPDTTIAACAAVGVVLRAVTESDSSFSYRWFDGDSVSPKNVRFAYDSLFFASVEVNGYCTSFRDSTQIRFLPPYVELGGDSLLCTYRTFADTTVMLRLSARQDYFPDADWIFRWQINGRDASDSDSLLLRYADLEDAGINFRKAVITIAVSLSDAEADGCTARDTVVFSLVSLPDASGNLFLPQDTFLCAHQDLSLQLPDTAENYRCFWLDWDSIEMPYGHDTARFTVQGMRGTDGFGAGTDTREPRLFQLRLEHKLCGVSYFDTLRVTDIVKPRFELPCHDTVICLDIPVELDSLSPLVHLPSYTFEWTDGEKGSARTFTDSGNYVLQFFVKEDFAFCGYDTATDTLRVLWSDPAMTIITLPADTGFCPKLSVTLDASVPCASTLYEWRSGAILDEEDYYGDLDSVLSTLPTRTFKTEGTFNISLIDTLNCRNVKEINITEEDCTPKLDIPNVFTPNGDGVNDVWRFRQLESCRDVVVEVVDRWGQPVLKQKVAIADAFEWNGTMHGKGRLLPDGPYFYMVSYKDVYGKRHTQSGSVTILGTRE